MAKYLIEATYTVQGTQGLLKEGGTKRRAAAAELIKSVGGTMEAFYYSVGGPRAILIIDVPDAVSVQALGVKINASGGVTSSATPLMTAEDMDQACGKTVVYRAPGA